MLSAPAAASIRHRRATYDYVSVSLAHARNF
jgi:hypothetical protein